MENIYHIWIVQQSQLIPGSKHATLFTGTPDEGPYDQSLCWPDNSYDLTPHKQIAHAAIRSKQPVLKTRFTNDQETGEPFDCLGYPLFVAGKLIGAYVIEMTNRPQAMQQVAIQIVQAGSRWLERLLGLHGNTSKQQLINLVELIATGLDNASFKTSITEVVNELSTRFNCQRVSIGFTHYRRIRLEAISHSNKIDRHTNLSRAIAEAMNETGDQATTILYPETSDKSPLTTRMHDALFKQVQNISICSVPLVKSGRVVGALLFERSADFPFSEETIEQCEQLGLLLGPVLESRKRNEQSIFGKILDSTHSTISKTFGPSHLTLKTSLTLCTILFAWMLLDTSTLCVTSTATLEASTCRAVTAPQEGYILQANVRAGDLVAEGTVMATLDDRDLRQKQRKWISQRAQFLKEYRKALAVADRAQISILNAKRAQAEAQLGLIEQQLERTELTSPVTGLVIKGDLNQSIGSPVERGEVLFEVAPTDEYRVIIDVDDLDIGLIKPGQNARLKLSGLPNQRIDLTIDKLTPISTSENGRNFFRVEALLDQQSDLMRPGMEGIAKIDIEQANLLYIWTRKIVQWWNLLAWKYLP